MIRTLANVWDQEAKELTRVICEQFETVDKLSQYYFSQMAFYIEHDLADGRSPTFRMFAVRGVLGTQTYLDIYKDHSELYDNLLRLKPLLEEMMENSK